MLSLVSALALTGTALFWPRPDEPRTTYLFRMQAKDGKVEFQRELFAPREGDIVLYDSHQPWITRVYRLVGTDGPLHAGIVYKKADGTPALLEAGANYHFKVGSYDVPTRFGEYDGTILVRRLRAPLTPEQSKKLTEFCEKQEGKFYAVGRLVLQGTPLKARGKLTSLLGRTSLDRDRWICSELVVAAATAAGVLDGKDFPANGIYPRDLAYDEQFNLGRFYHVPALWYPRGQLEYVDGGVRVAPGGRE
jgi:hypothetical protein